MPLGDRLLFGYNVFLGLKRQTDVEDVFSLHRLVDTENGPELERIPQDENDFLHDPEFVRDFGELYRYYKDAELVHLLRNELQMLAVFKTGDSERDVKVLRWAVEPDGSVKYIDNRGERDYRFPPPHDFEWTQATREDHVLGRFPHVSILDKVFVETTGGDLTIKVEDSTETGEGIYAEPVEDLHQSLDDADIQYAEVGVLILLKVRPYREDAYRYFVFNTRTQDVKRIDAIGLACIQLPGDHGIIFPGGYYLNTGETRIFATEAENLKFESVVRSPNGEDVLYTFYESKDGLSILLPYNLIRKEVQNPISVHGYSIFEDGRMIVFRYDSAEPTRVHPMQVWQTPFESDEFAAKAPQDTSFLGKVGNPELVRGISDVNTVVRMIENQQPTVQVYEDLIAAIHRTIDTYYWLGAEEVGDMLGTLKAALSTAEKIIDEFEKVLAIRERSRQALLEAERAQTELRRDSSPSGWSEARQYVDTLTAWRRQMGLLFSLRELRYIDVAEIDRLETEAREQFEALSKATVEFLLGDDSLDPYKHEIAAIHEQVEGIEKTADLLPLKEAVERIGTGFDVLTEIISGLKVDDPTVRTRILERVSEVYAQLNRTKAHVDGTYKELLGAEGVAQFGVEFKLFGQSVANSLAACDTPEKCDEQLSRLTVQLEQLETRFGEFDQFLDDLAAKRAEVYEAFETRKQGLLEERQRRSHNMLKAADRILEGIVRRASAFKTSEELNTFFVSDPMVAKVRDIASDLREMGEGVKADELLGKLKSSTQEAARAQRDRAYLFDEDNAIRLGRHRFTVNTEPMDLTLMPRDGRMMIHLTGTDFYDPIEDPELEATRPFWDQALVSENDQVYRGEFLAASILFDAESRANDLSFTALRAATGQDDGLLNLVRKYAESRYDEGYERGVHDADAAIILEALLAMRADAGLLKYPPRARAFAALFWAAFDDDKARSRLVLKARNLGRLRDAFEHSPEFARFAHDLGTQAAGFLRKQGLAVGEADAERTGNYLAEELAAPKPRFALADEAVKLKDRLLQQLDRHGHREAVLADLQALEEDLAGRYHLAIAWIDAVLEAAEDEETRALAPAAPETAAWLLTDTRIERAPSNAAGTTVVTGLLGQHGRIRKGRMTLRLDEFLTRLGDYVQEVVPRFRAYRKLRQRIIERERTALRLDEFRPRVLTSFVRNRLIDEVYLPLIGDNLAKQMGALGAGKRTDLMGMLLLISPPGYGKTTLMEYVANRLGLIFMKINGPAMGHAVTSIDPGEAPNATARQEVEKLNLALEMGNNVMLYVDDIQHTNPEFLQKFISLCDAQRKIEGVWRGRTRTHDLRGKRFCVVMAGNPYTESGEKFQIPDMLANRADTYNLGDILQGKEAVFELSYVENALTSNPVLAPLASRDPKDIYLLIDMARGREIARTDLAHDYTQAELDEILSVLQKLFVVQKTVLEVNRQYIASASQAEEYRTEPPFKLQGSYRNMNKIAEKIVPVMNDEELEAVIEDHYVGEAQTLTSGAEQNLLKFAELRGTLTQTQAERWNEIKKSYGRLQMMGGKEDDPVTRLLSPLGALVQEVRDVRSSIDDPVRHELVARVDALVHQIGEVGQGIDASIANDLHKPLTSLVEQLEAARAGVKAAVSEDVRGPLSALAEQLEAARAGVKAAVSEDVRGPLSALAEQLEAASADWSKAVHAEVGMPLAALGERVVSGVGDTGASVVDTLAARLDQLVEELGRTHAGLEASVNEAIHAPLAALVERVSRAQGGLESALADGLGAPLAALVGQVEAARSDVQSGVSEHLGQTLGALVEQVHLAREGMARAVSGEVSQSLAGIEQQLAQSREGVQASLAQDLARPLAALVEQLARAGKEIRASVDQDLSGPLKALAQQIEGSSAATVEAVDRVLAVQVRHVGEQIDALRRQLAADGSAQELGGRLESLAMEVKQIREEAPKLLYRPLVALAHQAYGIRKGLGDGIGPAFVSRLDRITERLDRAVVALERAVSPTDSAAQLANIAREMEELRYTMSAAIHATSPELSAKLEAMRNK